MQNRTESLVGDTPRGSAFIAGSNILSRLSVVTTLPFNMLELNTILGLTLSLSFSRDRDNDGSRVGSYSLRHLGAYE